MTCVTSYRGGLARPSDYTFLLSSLLVSVGGYPSISCFDDTVSWCWLSDNTVLEGY